MKIIIIAILAILLFMTGTSLFAGGSVSQDTRTSLGLTDTEKAEFLSEMRQMLVSIQGITTGIGDGNRQLIIQSARYSGNRMARATPESVRRKTSQEFKEIGGATHMMFEELVVRAETDDMDTLASFTGELMQGCIACHSIFRVQ